MKNLILTTLALLTFLAVALSVRASTYNIPWHRIGPGGTSAGGTYSVSGSAGQLDAGQMSGGNLSLSGGFWAWPDAPAGSALRITSTVRSGSRLQISFTSQAGRTYNVLSTSDLGSGTWSTLQTGILGNNATVQATIPDAFSQPRQFYRVQQAQ